MRYKLPHRPVTVYATYVFLGLLCIVLVLVFIRAIFDVQRLKKSGMLSLRHGFMFRKSTDGIVLQPAAIAGWMTFDYVNKIFGLPAVYLKQRFGIVDRKYPNIEIAQHAKDNNVTVALFLIEVRFAVIQYQVGALYQ